MNSAQYWIALAAGVATIVQADAREVRTATWFADHPVQHQQVRALCQDNPGQAKKEPNCANVFQADVIVAEREARVASRVDFSKSPGAPAYWLDPNNADQRRFWSLQCSRLPADAPEHVRVSMWCGAIKAAGG